MVKGKGAQSDLGWDWCLQHGARTARDMGRQIAGEPPVPPRHAPILRKAWNNRSAMTSSGNQDLHDLRREYFDRPQPTPQEVQRGKKAPRSSIPRPSYGATGLSLAPRCHAHVLPSGKLSKRGVGKMPQPWEYESRWRHTRAIDWGLGKEAADRGFATARERPPAWDQCHSTTSSQGNAGRHAYFRNYFDRPLALVSGNPLSPREARIREAEDLVNEPTFVALRKIRTPAQKAREAPFGVPGKAIGAPR